MYKPCTENPHTAVVYSISALFALTLRIIAIVPIVAPTAVAAITMILTAFFILVFLLYSYLFSVSSSLVVIMR